MELALKIGFMVDRKTARLFLSVACLLLYGTACQHQEGALLVRELQSPAPNFTLVPQVTRLADGKFAVSWQQKRSDAGYKFAMAVGDGEHWSNVRTIAGGPNLSMFTADLPGIAAMQDDALLAYWELKDTESGDPYATKIQTAISHDEGRTWETVKQPYSDALAGQHSFLSWFPIQESGVGLVWLDAQQRALVRKTSMMTGGHSAMDSEHGAIGLRWARLGPNGETVSDSFVVPITCECCPTSAALTKGGPVVLYRGRIDPPGTTPAEVDDNRPTIRDIDLTRLENGHWTAPHTVHADNWVINACPDNGPAVDAAGNQVAVAWWTASGNTPKVQVAFSTNAGDSFGPAIRIDAAHAEGQVTVAILHGEPMAAVVGWLEDGQVRARYVSASGALGPIATLGPSPRHSRLPRWYLSDGSILAGWTEKTTSGTQIKLCRLIRQ